MKKCYPLILISLFIFTNIQAQCWEKIASGGWHTLSIKTDGTLWTWGFNTSGQLGDGTTISKKLPVQVGSDTNWESVYGGGNFSVGRKTDGTLWAWGKNEDGQLGIGSNELQKTITRYLFFNPQKGTTVY